jgi:dTDP-4-amino-4,6-dideoxygalactose transaminase
MINVTKTFLPSFEEYTTMLSRAWKKGWVTNNGELVVELEERLREYLNVPYLLFCTNGTVVLQMALKALKITKEVITTPFSYVATTNALLWEGCKPVFVDIRSDNFCIDADKIETAITEKTEAILATHVYGIPCEVDQIESIAAKYNLKVIYDGAHVFGATYKGKSILSYGDISTCSFHATKVFHTVEGGAIICNNKELYQKLFLFRQFGHIYDDYIDIGINAKNSEFHAAMGLCLLPKMPEIIISRKETSKKYDALLSKKIMVINVNEDVKYNYAYYPAVFPSEDILMDVITALNKEGIFGRRYFYPSLNKLNYLPYQTCPISEDISKRVLCLPLYYEMENHVIEVVANIINSFF